MEMHLRQIWQEGMYSRRVKHCWSATVCSHEATWQGTGIPVPSLHPHNYCRTATGKPGRAGWGHTAEAQGPPYMPAMGAARMQSLVQADAVWRRAESIQARLPTASTHVLRSPTSWYSSYPELWCTYRGDGAGRGARGCSTADSPAEVMAPLAPRPLCVRISCAAAPRPETLSPTPSCSFSCSFLHCLCFPCARAT